MSEKKKKTDGLFDSRIVDSDVSEQPHYEHPHVKGFDGASFEPEEEQPADVGRMEDVEAIMRKYDRESNTRIWEGTPKLIVDILMALFSAYCIYSTLTTRAAIEIRLTAFMGCIMILGFLTYPASKKHVKVNSLPWYDIVLMILGAAAFFYYSFSYNDLSRVLTSPIRMTMTYNIIGPAHTLRGGRAAHIHLCERPEPQRRHPQPLLLHAGHPLHACQRLRQVHRGVHNLRRLP